MHSTFLDKAIELNKQNQAYATAVIVRRKIPSSGKPGDKALITADGQIHGWIGGGCTRGIVLKEAMSALQDRKPRLVAISPDLQDADVSDRKTYTMTCQSGGAVEVYIEPVLPKPHIYIFGTSHIAMALCRISSAMNYEVSVVMNTPDKTVFPAASRILDHNTFEKEELSENCYFVVCTQGEGDTQALYEALKKSGPYLSFVSSRKKANAIFSDLRKMGVEFDELSQIKTPAGLDIGAKLPEEVAISILAQIIEQFRKENNSGTLPNTSTKPAAFPNDDYYINPVCNIPVQKSTAKHVLTYQDEKVYFCCDGCKVSFEKEPEKYIVAGMSPPHQ